MSVDLEIKGDAKLQALADRLSTPETWSDAEKCMTITGVTMLWQFLTALAAWSGLQRPDLVPFLDQSYLPLLLWIQIIAFAATAGLFAACLILMNERAPVPVLVHVTIQLFTLSLCHIAYSMGLYTSPIGIGLATAIVGGALIFEWRPVVWGIVSGVVLLGGSTVLSELGMIPYAPAMKALPVTNGDISGWWLYLAGLPILFFSLLSLWLFVHVRLSWSEREERLKVANEELVDREEQLTAAYRDLSRSHARLAQFEKAVATAPVGITITDTTGKIVYTNRAEAEMHGYRSPDDLMGQPARVFARQDSIRPLSREQLKALGPLRRESINRRQDGTEFPVQLISDVIRNVDGEPLGVVTVSEDITQRKEFEELLRSSEERYALAIQGANDGIWDWDMASNTVFYSDRWKAMLGYEEDDIGTSPDEWLNRIHPDEREQVKHKINAHLEGHTSQFEAEYRIQHRDGDYRWCLARGLAVRDHTTRASRMAGSQTDITERSLVDPLTGLPNRTLFMDRLRRAFDRARQNPERGFAILLLGLNRFNNVNETLGRPVGDQLLFMVAARLQNRIGAGNTVARLGGDEFTILVEDIRDPMAASRVADQLLDDIKNPFKLYGREVFITASVGIAPFDHACDRPEDALRNADTAMRRAKSTGAVRHQTFDAAMREAALVRFEIESDLRRAVEKGQLFLHYQPIVTLKDGRTTGFEALVRWKHPVKGVVSPLDFIGIAEDTGQINAIGLWVLQEACRQMQQWYVRYPEKWPLTVSVNLSGKQFTQPDLIHRIDQILKDSRLDRRSLKLEITESVLMHDASQAADTLVRLKELGLKLCMDDFGTGYSSLSYLNRFPFDTMKIDKSFVHRVDASEADYEIVRAMVSLAHNLGMDVVAEGVETEAQIAALLKAGCDYGQGFHYARPMPGIDAETAFRAQAGRTTISISAFTRRTAE